MTVNIHISYMHDLQTNFFIGRVFFSFVHPTAAKAKTEKKKDEREREKMRETEREKERVGGKEVEGGKAKKE